MKKEGYLLENRTVKIVLVAILAVVLILVVVFWLSFKNNKELAEIEDGGTSLVPSDQGEQITKQVDETQTALVPGQTSIPTPSVTPHPGSGEFDWTRQPQPVPLEVELTPEQIKALSSNDVCEMANLSDNWSDPIEKFSCGLLRYTETQIIYPLQVMACNFLGAAIASNYEETVKVKLINNRCLIIDR